MPFLIFAGRDVHDRAVTSELAPAAHVEAVEKKLAAVPLGAESCCIAKLAGVRDGILRLAEEQLQVGKQMGRDRPDPRPTLCD